MHQVQEEGFTIFNWKENELLLLPEKAVFLPQYRILMIADPHFGKAAHFRKAGVPIPENVHFGDLVKIHDLVQRYQPESLFFLGDLFHSDINESWNDLEAFVDTFAGLPFHLVKGNHDILPAKIYRSSKWIVHNTPYELGEFLLSHEPMQDIPAGKLNLCGHVHPGMRLTGGARQSLTLPCFFISPNQMILPAFGRFTGLATMKCSRADLAYVIAGPKVIPVNFMA